MKECFLQETYYSEDYPSSVANAMFHKLLLGYYLTNGGDMEDNVKVYIKWLRKIRDNLFPHNPHKKGRKFVQIYGLKRSMTVHEAFDFARKKGLLK